MALSGHAMALDTDGYVSASAIHSVFGRPALHGKLHTLNARKLAWHLRARVPGLANACERVSRAYGCSIETFWKDLVKRFLQGKGSMEAFRFCERLWKSSNRAGTTILWESTKFSPD